jgi:Tol biopolymer transport system component
MKRAALLALLVVGATPSGAQTPLPDPTPDQGVIVFLRQNLDTFGPARLEVVDVATGTVRLLRKPGDIHGPAISADGRSVAYLLDHGSRGNELRVIGIDGQGDHRVLRVNDSRHICECGPAWTPDGKRLVYTQLFTRGGNLNLASADIYTTTLDGKTRRRLTRNLRTDDAPVVSADGKRIFFTRESAHDTDIFSIAIGGGDERRLTAGDTALDLAPAAGPDGRIVYERCTCNNGGEDSTVRVMNADGSGAHVVVATPGSSDTAPVWAPGGAQIAFASDRDAPGTSQIYVAAADGSGARRLVTSKLNDDSPSWGPSAPSVIKPLR